MRQAWSNVVLTSSSLLVFPAVSPERGYPVPLEESIMEGYSEDTTSCHENAEAPSGCSSQLWREGEKQKHNMRQWGCLTSSYETVSGLLGMAERWVIGE